MAPVREMVDVLFISKTGATAGGPREATAPGPYAGRGRWRPSCLLHKATDRWRAEEGRAGQGRAGARREG